MSFTRQDYEGRIMTLEENGVKTTVKISIKTTMPILYISDQDLTLKHVEDFPSQNIERTSLKVIDKITVKVANVDTEVDRYKFLQKFRGLSNNRLGNVFYDRKLKDIIIIPDIEAINMKAWRQNKNDCIMGYRVGSATDMSFNLHKTEISLGLDVNDIVELPEPAAYLGKTYLIDAYGVQPGDTGTHYNDVIYYERPKLHNGVEVNFGIQRYQTDTTTVICLGSIADMFPDGLQEGLPVYGITQPDVTFFSSELLGRRVKPDVDDKLYVLIDI